MSKFKKEVIIAKTSGFCFGVNRAVNAVETLLNKGKKVCTLGQIIHSPQVIEGFLNRGVEVLADFSKMPENNILVIRAHGITKTIFESIKSKNINFLDATCPFVKKIHNIVEKESLERKILLLAGDKNHPEVIGIKSYFQGKCFIFNTLSELKKIVNENGEIINEPVVVVSQTTFSLLEWKKCIDFIKKYLTDVKIFDTICNTTNNRQIESEKLSKECDLMLVIGGKQSSNTKKLYDICAQNTKTFLIESFEEVYNLDFESFKKIGIVAGASTPMSFVRKIYEHIVKQDFKGRQVFSDE